MLETTSLSKGLKRSNILIEPFLLIRTKHKCSVHVKSKLHNNQQLFVFNFFWLILNICVDLIEKWIHQTSGLFLILYAGDASDFLSSMLSGNDEAADSFLLFSHRFTRWLRFRWKKKNSVQDTAWTQVRYFCYHSSFRRLSLFQLSSLRFWRTKKKHCRAICMSCVWEVDVLWGWLDVNHC